MTLQGVKTIRKELKVGQNIVLLEPIENGVITLNPFETGQLIYLQNQVRATVWFRHFGLYADDKVARALGLDTSHWKNGRLDGITLELNRESFAIKYEYQGFNDISVSEENALTIPFFVKDDAARMPTNMKLNKGNGVFDTIYQYQLIDVIDTVSDNFSSWAQEHTTTRKIKESEREDYPEGWDTVLTEDSQTLFFKKKQEVELGFAKATGIFYEFNGGLLVE